MVYHIYIELATGILAADVLLYEIIRNDLASFLSLSIVFRFRFPHHIQLLQRLPTNVGDKGLCSAQSRNKSAGIAPKGAAMLLGQEGKSEQKNMEIFVEYYGGVTNHLSML